MKEALQAFALRGAERGLAIIAFLVGAGFLTAVGYQALAAAYDSFVAGVIFGLGYLALAGALWALAATGTSSASSSKEIQPPEAAVADILTVFIDGMEKGSRARKAR